MDFLMEREINGLRSDVSSTETSLNAQRFAFEQELKNGLGEEIKKTLEPKKQSKWKLFMKRFKSMLLGGQYYG